MNKRFNNFKKKVLTLTLSLAISLSSFCISFADGARVVTLGANLNTDQKATMLKYFGVNENEVVLLEVNNQEERKYLQGVATEAQLGNKTFSCAYVEPTKKGSGINVKTANLTWLTSSMVASTLSTAGLTDADVVVASVFPVSGTGALTGIMKAFEDSTGKPLEEDKKELASEELIVTGGLGEDIGADKATGIVNDIKTEIIKNNTSDTIQIADTIVNVTNNYNVTLTPEQQKQLEDLMAKIAEQDYNYNEMKDTLNGIKDTVNEKLDEIGESIDKGFFDSIKDFFSGIGDWFSGLFEGSENKDLGILGTTNDSILGEDAIIDATDKDAIQLPSNEEVEGFFSKIWNWFTGLFNSDDSNSIETPNDTNSDSTPSQEDSNSDFNSDSSVDELEQNSTVDENVQPDSSTNQDSSENSGTTVDTPSEDITNNNDSLNTTDSENTTP
ncbi:MAG: DUF1002 domain-containing protein [Peptostreptococcaceae bacterium]